MQIECSNGVHAYCLSMHSWVFKFFTYFLQFEIIALYNKALFVFKWVMHIVRISSFNRKVHSSNEIIHLGHNTNVDTIENS